MNEEVTRVVADLLEFMTENLSMLGFLVSFAYVVGPSWMVFLEKRGRLSQVLVWAYALVIIPIVVLGMLAIVSPEPVCGVPLAHDEFRFFYPLWLPMLPLFWFYFRSAEVQHPFLYASMLVALSVGVFLLTFGYEVVHFTYQEVHGTGIVYSGVGALECAVNDTDALATARRWRDGAAVAMALLLTVVMAFARRRKRGQTAGASADGGTSSDGSETTLEDRGMPKM